MTLKNKKGQMTIFVILAVLAIGAIVLYFAVREQTEKRNIPAELAPVFSYYQECVEDELEAGISLAESQGGHVSVPEYIPGSEYAPFSSQLNFLGFPVPYWFYVSGNGVIKEQIPSKSEMEDGLEKYILENLASCNFEHFYEQGFSLEFSKPRVSVRVEQQQTIGKLMQVLTVSKGESSAQQSEYEVKISSKLGKLYGIARELYKHQREEVFLENYTIDVLRLYTPVDGVEISCAPKIWKIREVLKELHDGLESNIAELKFKTDGKSLQSKKQEYFIIDKDVDAEVRVLYSRQWPGRVEIIGEGVQDELLIAEPVGNQQGLGVMGFCYAPYHFVYDLSYPVLFQIFEGQEFFQFPVVVVIDNNLPREADLQALEEEIAEPADICELATQELEVSVYDINLQSVDANISYTCFQRQCRLGESDSGVLRAKVPACLNGYLNVRAEGFAEKQQLFSSNEENKAEVILDREYEVMLELFVGDKILEGSALVTFNDISQKKSFSAFLPETKSIRISEGQYELIVYAYGNTSFKIPESSKSQCQEVSRSGLLGLFGSTKKECFDITIPETNIDYALIGGGRSKIYLLASELEQGNLTIRVDAFPEPRSLEQLQYNFEAVSGQDVEVSIS